MDGYKNNELHSTNKKRKKKEFGFSFFMYLLLIKRNITLIMSLFVCFENGL